MLASGGELLKVWEVRGGRELVSLQRAGGHHALAFRPDGHRLASGGGLGTITVWGVGRWEELLTYQAHARDVSGIAYSVDGGRLASVSVDDWARIWDAATGRELLALPGNNCVAFSP